MQLNVDGSRLAIRTSGSTQGWLSLGSNVSDSFWIWHIDWLTHVLHASAFRLDAGAKHRSMEAGHNCESDLISMAAIRIEKIHYGLFCCSGLIIAHANS